MAIGNSTIQYFYTGRGPLDTKALVQKFADLIKPETWLVNSNDPNSSAAYNGMLTAVWLDKNGSVLSDKNGVYLLFDPTITSTRNAIPDVTKEANWHKLAEVSELDAFVGRLSALQDELAALGARVTALEEASDVITYGYRKDFPLVGEAGKMYVAEDLKRTYVWANNQYVVVGAGFEEDVDGALLINGGSAD